MFGAMSVGPVMGVLLWVLGTPCRAQSEPATAGGQVAQPAVVINYRERPRYPHDPQRLKLRPTLDGEIRENEWTPLYTIGDQPVKGTVYLNWDDETLFVAARMDQPGWFVFNLDAACDGWLRGADNLEVVVAPVGAVGVAPVTVRLLDAGANRDAPVWNEAVVEAKSIALAVKQDGAGQVVELGIPRGAAGLMPRSGAQIAVRGDFLPAATTPAATAPYEPHLLLDVTLVEAKVVAAPGIVPRLALEDTTLVPGQTLHANLDLSNQLEQPRGVRSVSWSGVGAAEALVKTLREVNVADAKPLKTMRLRYSSPLPDNAVPGFYQFTATATLDDGSVVSSTASFSVEEAFTIMVEADPTEVALIGPTPVKLQVTLSSAAPGFKRCQVEIAPPASWELKGKPVRSVNVHRENGVAKAHYVVTLPSATQAGEYRVDAKVTWRGRTWLAHRTIRVTRSEK
ncbi:MAG: hypothetical protein FJX72_21505 [Armatimonadetes bacterium]|nr:hypothetical protein [Armatimonadota bacterium]